MLDSDHLRRFAAGQFASRGAVNRAKAVLAARKLGLGSQTDRDIPHLASPCSSEKVQNSVNFVSSSFEALTSVVP